MGYLKVFPSPWKFSSPPFEILVEFICFPVLLPQPYFHSILSNLLKRPPPLALPPTGATSIAEPTHSSDTVPLNTSSTLTSIFQLVDNLNGVLQP